VYNKELGTDKGIKQDGQSEGHTTFEQRWVGAQENHRKSSPFCSSHKERVGNHPKPKERLANRHFEQYRKASKH
jgi:hypothetical protein